MEEEEEEEEEQGVPRGTGVPAGTSVLPAIDIIFFLPIQSPCQIFGCL